MQEEEEKHYSSHGAIRGETMPNKHQRAFAHDYQDAGTYMVMIVTEGRVPVFGHIEGNALATKKQDRMAWMHDMEAPHIVLSELGRQILEEEVPKIGHFFPQVEVWRVAMMPDHIHLLICVKEQLPEGRHLGQVVRGFKTGCTRAWWALQDAGKLPDGKAPGTIGVQTASVQTATTAAAAVQTTITEDEGSRQSVVSEDFSSDSGSIANVANSRSLLFAPGYSDRIISRPGMLDSIKRYMLENPLRARIRQECPRLMERRLHLWVNGREYAAFGNLFLLKYPLKEQVFFHRYTEVEASERKTILASSQLTEKEQQHINTDPQRMPTHLTAFYTEERARLLKAADEGVVLVTPGISKGESLVVQEALDGEYPLILLQARPIGPYWRPDHQRFFACSTGSLLILSPWELEGFSDYEHFHRLNDLAREICETTEVRIMEYSKLMG